MIFPVITLHQPWATWVTRSWKTIETRTHRRFAGLAGKKILIHAGLGIDSGDAVIKNPYLTKSQIIYNPDEVISGFILCVAQVSKFSLLNDSHSKAALIDCGNTQRYGLFLENIERLPPIQVSGERGVWYFNLSTGQKVKKELCKSKSFGF